MELTIDKRDYSSWSFTGDCDILPIERKLFHGDVIGNFGELLQSPIRTMGQIPGILILDDGKTYGRTDNGKRLLYRCIPDNDRFPVFLVPYDLKLGFSKDIKNKFVMFKLDKWTDKHPIGIITETIGDVSTLEFYYEYQLHRYRLNESITNFINTTRKLFGNTDENLLISKIIESNKFIKNRLTDNIITIDPIGCVDIDDGFSCQTNIETGITIMSIYISNVSVWMSTFDLWNDITRVSTIYLPDKRRTMLPSILSDNLCSLIKNKQRIALCMDVSISGDGQMIGEPRFENAVICVKNNHSYDSIRDPQYLRALEITRKINSKVKDSHEFIEYWMVFMNVECGKRLAFAGKGVFKRACLIEDRSHVFENPLTQTFFNTWGNINSEYSIDYNSTRHDVLDVSSYTQITSPIRRCVDLINQSQFVRLIDSHAQSDSFDKFITTWFTKIDYLNVKMKSIRRIQNDCDIMRMCYNVPDLSDLGIVFDEVECGDGYKYIVYLENLKLLSSVKTLIKIENHSRHRFRLFVFEDEHARNRKIRLEII